MAVLNRAGVLGIYLRPSPKEQLRVGTLVRDASGVMTFDVDENYIRLGERDLSSAWRGKARPTTSRSHACATGTTSRRAATNLPSYFENLLPEGALLELVEKEFGTGAFDSFDVLRKLGMDLPGAILARAEAGDEPPAARMTPSAKPTAPKVIRFSLAGVQLKFSMRSVNRRLTMPGVDESGDVILKLPTTTFPGLPEAEYTALQLAKLAVSIP